MLTVASKRTSLLVAFVFTDIRGLRERIDLTHVVQFPSAYDEIGVRKCLLLTSTVAIVSIRIQMLT